jgi:hypothetical protein
MMAMALAATSAVGAAGSVLDARFKKSGMPSSWVSGALTLTFIVISMGFLSAGALAARRSHTWISRYGMPANSEQWHCCFQGLSIVRYHRD